METIKNTNFFYLHKNKDNLYHGKYNFNIGANTWVTVEVTHIAGDLKDIHDDTEDSKQKKSR